MNKDLTALLESHARFVEISGNVQKTYEEHRNNIARLREFIEVEDLVCNRLLEQIHTHLFVRRLIESTVTLKLKSGEVYSLTDGRRYIALRKDPDTYLLFDEETGFYSPAVYEITVWGDVVPRFDSNNPWNIEELTSTAEVYFPQP
jgi:hypothetical protein